MNLLFNCLLKKISMKHFFCLFILIRFTSSFCFAQNSADSVFYINKIPPEGIVLDKGWKFHTGDNPEWSKQGYNDKEWTSINPTIELHHLPLLREAEIGWFRLKMQVDSSLQGERVTIAVSNMGASEIYLNEQLIYRFGVVSSHYKEEQTLFFQNRLLSLKLGKGTYQTLAIRYSFNKRNLYLKFTFPRPLLKIVLKEANKAYADRIWEEGFYKTLRVIQVSVYLTLVFLLLFLYFSYRLKKEYMYFGFFFFSVLVGSLMRSFSFSNSISVSWSNCLLLAYQIFIILAGLAFINSVYILYKQKRGWLYYIIVLYSLIAVPFYFVSYDSSGLFTACLFPVTCIEFSRINLQAVRHRKPGAMILLGTGLATFIVIFCYILFAFMGRIAISAFFQGLIVIIPGMGFSLFIADDFARTGSALRLRVNEVEDLSMFFPLIFLLLIILPREMRSTSLC